MVPADGSRTIIMTDSNPREIGESDDDTGGRRGGSGERVDGVLHLRGAMSTRPSVRWTEATVDNEGMGKKKSKSECLCLCFGVLSVGRARFLEDLFCHCVFVWWHDSGHFARAIC